MKRDAAGTARGPIGNYENFPDFRIASGAGRP